MSIKIKLVITIHYKLTDDEGAVLESTIGGDPLVYLHGADKVIRGLELALLGKKAGDIVRAQIKPENAYGEVNEQLIQEAPRVLSDDQEVSAGM